VTESDAPAIVAALVVVGPQTDELTRFRLTVELLGVSLVAIGAEPAGAPVVVLITDAEVSTSPDGIPAGREVLPVLLAPGASPLFPKTSHLVLDSVGWDVAAMRLVNTVRYGGRQLLDWAQLVDAAKAWSEHSTSPMLDVADQTSAIVTLGTRIAASSPIDAAVVRSYLASSVARSTRKRRVATAIVTGVGVVLVAATIAAATQAVATKRVGDLSITQADNATASRISSYAADDTSSDPDIPALLAAKAIGMSSLPAVRNAVGMVASNTVAHISRPLDTVAHSLAVSDDGHFAVGSEQSSTVELLSPSGRVEHTVRYASKDSAWKGAQVALDPDDQTLVIGTDEGIALYSAKGSPQPGLVQGTKGWTIQGWTGPHELLVVGPSGAARLDTKTRKSHSIAGAPAGVVRAAVSHDGSYLAIATSDHVDVLDASSGNLIHSVEATGIHRLGVSDDGATVVAAAQYGAKLMRWTQAAEPATKRINETIQSVAIVPLGNGYFATAWIDGTVSIIAAAPSRSLDLEVSRFPADSAGVFAIASTSSGELASAGADGYLRTWRTQNIAALWHNTTVGIATVKTKEALGVGSLSSSFLPIAVGNQIRYTVDGHLALGLRYANDVLSVTGVNDPSPNGSFIGEFSRSFLSDDGKWVASVSGGMSAKWTVMVQQLSPDPLHWIDTQPTIRTTATMPEQSNGTLLGPILAAVTTDGKSVAIAASTEVRLWTTTTPAPSTVVFARPSTPLAVTVDRDGARVVTTDGLLHQSDGSTQDLLKAVQKVDHNTSEIVAAVFGQGSLYVLTDTGGIAKLSNSSARIILKPGLISGVGTLRLSNDGSRIATVTPDGVTVIDQPHRKIVARWNTIVGIRADDVAFSKDGKSLAMIADTSQIAVVSLSNSSLLPIITVPREATSAEDLQYDLGGTGG
jgi:WD40 repeat protein